MADSTPPDQRSIDTELEAPVESSRGGMPRIGDVVAGRYRIQRILGSGGMGVVVEAQHTLLGELVAIKFLRADARNDPAISERFLREAKASSQLKGEHVARVYDLGTTEAGHAYLVMEHLSGSDLSTLISDRGALPVSEAVDYVLQACEGLAEAHARGIVHRDLKPSNLFLTSTTDRDALIKLLDFGIAKANTEAPNAVALTETHAVFGSPAYMSPEQIRSAKNVDARTDIWSLGVVLFELLSATLPFRGESSTSVLAAVAADKPLTLKSLRPEIPAELSDLVGRCLEKDPVRRVQSVLELAVGLLPFAAGRSTISVERIRRMAASPPPSSTPSLKPHGAGALTGRAWATTSPAPSTAPPLERAKRNPKLLAVIPLAVAAIVGVGYAAIPGRGAKDPPRSRTSATVSNPPPVAEVPPEPAAPRLMAPEQAADAGGAANTARISTPTVASVVPTVVSGSEVAPVAPQRPPRVTPRRPTAPSAPLPSTTPTIAPPPLDPTKDWK